MNVYVESNFVLELALEQEEADSCNEIVRLSSDGKLKILIPAFSLAEPHQAISGKAKTRSRLGNDLRMHLGELGRFETTKWHLGNFGIWKPRLPPRVAS